MKSIIDLWRGIWRHPLKTLQHIFTSFSVIFTVIKMITHFVPAIKIEGIIRFYYSGYNKYFFWSKEGLEAVKG